MFINLQRLAMIKKLPVLLFVCILFLSNLINAQEFNSLQFEFSQEILQPKNREYYEGTIYFQKTPHIFVMHITSPVNQIVYFKLNETFIYYPDQKKAIQMLKSKETIDPMEQEILTVFQKDKGLAANKFVLNYIINEEDTFVSFWTPPESAKNLIKEVKIVTNQNENIISSTTINPKGKTLSSSVFTDYKRIQKVSFPSLSIIKTYSPEEVLLVKSSLIIKSLKINTILPNSITNFILPTDCTTEVIPW